MTEDENNGGLVKAGELLPNLPAVKRSGVVSCSLKTNGPTELRLIKTRNHIDIGDGLDQVFSHSAFCQVGLPYRNPGTLREWQRRNGNVLLKIIAGEAYNAKTGDFVKVALPWGPKVRLVQIYLDSMAVKTRSRIIETDKSLTSFITDKLKLSGDGRTINSVKSALSQLAASTWRLGISEGNRAITINTQMIETFSIWMEKDDRQRVLFPHYVEYSEKYFENLLVHAVPLVEEAVTALAHNAMALDLYRWLAHRLDRVPPNRPYLLTWNLLHEQFGFNIARLDNFRREFKRTLSEVLAVYPHARGKVYPDAEYRGCKDGRGMILEHAEPPVKKTQVQVLMP